MAYWLLKSEPSAFSIDDLAARPGQTEPWDGIRNYQARNFIRDDMQAGDEAFFYHSNTAEPGIVGVVRIVSGAYPDPTAFDPQSPYFDPKSHAKAPRWYLVDVQLVRKLNRVITLQELKARDDLGDFTLTRKGNRLSVMPVTAPQWTLILSLE